MHHLDSSTHIFEPIRPAGIRASVHFTDYPRNVPRLNARSGSQSSLREANSARVLDAIRKYGRITQVELSAATGLAPATISNIIKQLSAQGSVELTSTIRSGRRAQLVSLTQSSTLTAGISIGRRALDIYISDESRTSEFTKVLPLPVDHKADTTLDRATLLVLDLLEQAGQSLDDLAGIGVALPSPINPKTGTLTRKGIMRGWEDINIAEVFQRRLGRDTIVMNDANAAVAAENRFGSLRGFSSCAYIRASYQTGAGILVGGKVYSGATGIAGEIGHVIVDPHGPICTCGARGCLNTVVGADYLVDLLRLSRGPMTLRDLLSHANEGDPGCQQVLSDAGSAIGRVIADLVTVFDLEAVAVGGELMNAGDTFLSPIQNALFERPYLRDEGITVYPSKLGADAEAIGAMILAQDAFVPSYSTHRQEDQ